MDNIVDKIPIAHNTIYTAEWCSKELMSLYDDLMSNENKVTWQDLIRDKNYAYQRISEWKRDFPLSCSDTYKKINAELADRVFKLGLNNKGNAVMAIFGLKCNHKWNDKIAETETAQNINISFGN